MQYFCGVMFRSIQQAAKGSATVVDHRRRLAKASELMRGAGQGLVRIQDLATAACYSPRHFHRVFAHATGETAGAAFRRRRLDAAAMKLASSDLRVITIALEAGFESHEGFTRAFRARFGVPPFRFRKQFPCGLNRIRLAGIALSLACHLGGGPID